jgi:hypothetical protein
MISPNINLFLEKERNRLLLLNSQTHYAIIFNFLSFIKE